MRSIPFHGTLSRHGITRSSSVLRRHRALLLVVKVVFVVFPNSAGLFGTAQTLSVDFPEELCCFSCFPS